MQLYFAVPDTATTHDGVLVRSFLRQCAVSTDLARAVKFQGSGFFADGCAMCWPTAACLPRGRCFLCPAAGGVAWTPQPEIPGQGGLRGCLCGGAGKAAASGGAPHPELPRGTLANGYAAWAAEHGHSPVFRPVNRMIRTPAALCWRRKTPMPRRCWREGWKSSTTPSCAGRAAAGGRASSMHPSAAGATALSGAALPPRASPAAPSILL